jgi:hypothetical protein
MNIKYLFGALALTMSTAAFAAEPAAAPNKECCCCKKDEQGKMACCKEKDAKSGDEHKDHDMGGMDHK